MDMDTFFERIRGNLVGLMNEELRDLNVAKVQTTAWIRFKVQVKNGDGNVIRIDTVDKAFNSRITQVLKGSDLTKL